MMCHFIECLLLDFWMFLLRQVVCFPPRILYNHGQKTKYTTSVCMKRGYIKNLLTDILRLKFYDAFCICENYGCLGTSGSVFTYRLRILASLMDREIG